MARYSADYGPGPTRYGAEYGPRPRRYGGEYGQWGSPSRYGGDYGFRGQGAGRFYDREFSGYGPRDRDMGGMYRYDRGYQSGGGRDDFTWRDEMREMDRRPYPSPWGASHPGREFGYGLGFGQGRGRYIYK